MRLTLAVCFVALLPAAGWGQGQPGAILSWGQDNSGQVSKAPAGTNFRQVAAGSQHSLALRSDGSIVSWGYNAFRQVSDTPTGTGFTQVAAGYHHSLALKADGSIASWGWDYYGQVGWTPIGQGFIQVAAGRYHSLALKADGSIVSWGLDTYAQVSSTPTGIGFTAVAAGGYHSLALKTDGSIISWGYNTYGQVSRTPTSKGFAQVAAGSYHSLALKADGSIVSWGHDTYAQVSKTPTSKGFTDLSGGGYHSLALSGPVATYTAFGTGCGKGPPILAPTAGSLPKLGQLFNLDISRLSNNQTGILFTGATDKTWSGVPLPFALDPIGMSGCTLYVSTEFTTPFSSGPSNHYTWSVTIPNQATLLGIDFFQQAFVTDPSANALGVATSNAGKGTVGY